jgi:hypothetical protein
MEVIQLVVPLVSVVVYKPANIIEHQFGVVHKRESPGSGITEKLVAEPTKYT